MGTPDNGQSGAQNNAAEEVQYTPQHCLKELHLGDERPGHCGVYSCAFRPQPTLCEQHLN